MHTSWWADAERWGYAGTGEPPGTGWRAAAARLLAADQALEPADRLGERLQHLHDAPSDVREALELWVALRARSADLPVLAERAAELARRADPHTAARAWHLAGLALTWLGSTDAACEALLAGLDTAGPSPRRTWILDSLATVLIADGAWTEARKVLDVVRRHRVEAGDRVGVAITAGRQADLELGLANPAAARDAVAAALDAVGDDPRVSRLRLATAGLLASVELGAADPELFEQVRLGLRDPDAGYLRGLAALALLRADARSPHAPGWLQVAREVLVDAEGREQVLAWEEHLSALAGTGLSVPTTATSEDVPLTEGAFLRCVLRSERSVASGDRRAALAWLSEALAIASSANRPLWIAEADRRYASLDPVGSALKASERFSGLPASALGRTVQEEVTIVFNDLVGFTDRSQTLAPVEVMDTVRSLFEVAAPVLARHGVRPLQYLGDGLLAVAQGPDHAARGRAFALDLVARCGRITRIRAGRGEPFGLTTRAGVATGTVVLGLVGSFAKLEHLAIGRTTNLAARLQGVAAPGQVVWALREGEPGLADAERVRLKGFDAPVPIGRVQADPHVR